MLRLLLPFLLVSFASAQETLIRQMFDTATDTHVEVVALFSKPSSSGYFPVRVKIANNLKSERSIRLNFSTENDYSSNIRSSSSFGFSAPGGKTVIRDILVPLPPSAETYGSNVTLKVDLKGSLGETTSSVNANHDANQPSVLLSEKLFTPNASKLDAEAASKFGGGRYGGSNGFASKFSPGQMPDDWLAYSGYDSILLTDSDWTSMPAGARNAVLSWMRLGGQLFIHTTNSATPASLGLPTETSFGKIQMVSIPASLALDVSKTVDRVSTSSPIPSIKSSLLSDFNSSWPLQTLFGQKSFRYALFILILTVFGILVGPVNLFVFAKSGRRHRLFITTPLISLGASAILVGLIVLQDGFGGSGRRLVLMEVRPDGDQNAAFIHQEQISRTGVLTRSGFTVDTPAFFTPVPIATSPWARFTTSNAKGTFNLQPSGASIEASGDWFQSRSEQGHALSAVIPTRGRIEATPNPEQMVSTFDFPIETLFYTNDGKHWHRADKIETGKTFKLTPIEITMADPAITELGNAFTSRNAQLFKSVRDRAGHFIAVTDNAPAINTHPGVRWEETRTVITGPVVPLEQAQ